MNKTANQFYSRHRLHLRILLGCGLLAALAAVQNAQAAKMVVMEVRGTALKVGGAIDGAENIVLKEGERLSVIGPDGKTVTRRGPYSGPVLASGSSNPDPKQALSVLVATRDARTSAVGVVRSGATAARLPSPWLIDITRAGPRCLRDGSTPVMWRPEARQALPFVIYPADRSWRADFQWNEGDALLQMPPLSRFQGLTTMLVNIEQQEHAISFSVIPKEVDNPIVLVAWMLEKGCIQQADAILESMRTAASANDKK